MVFGALLFGFVSRTITKPLDNLVAGVRALAAGDYTYSIVPEGTSEIAELSTAFAKMRSELAASQQKLADFQRDNNLLGTNESDNIVTDRLKYGGRSGKFDTIASINRSRSVNWSAQLVAAS